MDPISSCEKAAELKIARSFGYYHGRLFDICLNEIDGRRMSLGRYNYHEPSDGGINTINSEQLTIQDLEKMKRLVEMEFVTSLHHAWNGSESSDNIKTPNIFDVFLMKNTLDWTSHTSRKTSQKIAICVSYKKKLRWWNGLSLEEMAGHHEPFWDLDSNTHVRKLASLSGTVRVLQALDSARESLMALGGGGNQDSFKSTNAWLIQSVMNRQNIHSIVNSRNDDIEEWSERIYTKKVKTSWSTPPPMNASQRKAVHALSQFDSGIFCIQGPPGCGKTTTMVNMIVAALQKGNVIVTAPSNAAVANIALKLCDSGMVKYGDMVVFGKKCDQSVQFLQPESRSIKYESFLVEHESILRTMDKKAPLPNQVFKAQRLIDDFAKWIHLRKENLDKEGTKLDDKRVFTLKDISNVCKILPRNINGDLMIEEVLSEAKIVFCTLNSAGSPFLHKTINDSFTSLMLDEGGQCTEAEFFIAATFPGIRRIIIMGDPKQLPPTVLDPRCVAAGYRESFLAQIFKFSRESVHLLDTQYRMEPEILAFPNKRFYHNRINCGENVMSRDPWIERPFLLVDTGNRGAEEKIGFSYQNQFEAALINILLQSDKDIRKLIHQKLDTEVKVIIITPYKTQMKLLREEVRLPKGSNAALMISTVDSFQGQEGDIVILSTVRTHSVGFVDHPQRLNVALTRAKRVLRVVGSQHFFLQQKANSTLKALKRFAINSKHIEVSRVKRLRFCPPDWSEPTLWKIELTQSFHHCIFQMSDSRTKNVCLNILFALAKPDLEVIKGGRVAEHASYKMNCLTAIQSDIYVVWIARQSSPGTKLRLQAHYAGTRSHCLHFVQKKYGIQKGSLVPKSDMSGALQQNAADTENEGRKVHVLTPSWVLDNGLQHGILTGDIHDMPLCMVDLDPQQKKVAQTAPPLLIESRSGTGKTLVLMQHAALMTRRDQSRPACFVTVSPRLKEELKKKYEELKPILFNNLPPTAFFSLRELLSSILDFLLIQDFRSRGSCTFKGYVAERSSHKGLPVEAAQIENEIGGVIMGALEAAIQGSPLTRSQYLQNKRSNVQNTTNEGIRIRNLIYDEFIKYSKWKSEFQKYDQADIVIRILREDLDQFFSSAYIDEVQDLSHAAIFLVCKVAGKDSQYWVCAGDPAQMISPGCSFTFDGLKQTLLALSPGIEKKLKSVQHLLVNYRTTKDVLLMANGTLDLAKKSFPGAIEYALPETAVKDLGLKVVTCDWNDALETKVKFGLNQSFIYSPCDSATLFVEGNAWLDHHPFILSSLDSKGLEFDDVVVAFDLDTKYWEIDRKLDTSLRMLRELYVAITRAQRRVVILVKKKNKGMKSFFRRLKCEEVEARNVLQEFDRETTLQHWFERGRALFQDQNFSLASSCFTRAEEHGWAFLSNGKRCLWMGQDVEAEAYFREAVLAFREQEKFERILDILSELLHLRKDWDGKNDGIFLEALQRLPSYLSEKTILYFGLKRDDWESFDASDLGNQDFADFFIEYRQNKNLRQIVQQASPIERTKIEGSIPWACADFFFTSGHYLDALPLFLICKEYENAVKCSELHLRDGATRREPHECMKLVGLWSSGMKKAYSCSALRSDTRISVLLSLFHDPVKAAQNQRAMKEFGQKVVRYAVLEVRKLDITFLLKFNDRVLYEEVLETLEQRFLPHQCNLVKWLIDNGYSTLASTYAKKQKWSTDDLVRLTISFRQRPGWLFQDLEKNSMLHFATLMVLSSTVSPLNKVQYCEAFEGYIGRKVSTRSRLKIQTNLNWLMLKRPQMAIFSSQHSLHKAFAHSYFRHPYMAVKSIGECLKSSNDAEVIMPKILRICEEYPQKYLFCSKEYNHFEAIQRIIMVTDALQEHHELCSQRHAIGSLMSFPQKFREVSTSTWVKSEDQLCQYFANTPFQLPAFNDVEFVKILTRYGPVVASYARLHTRKDANSDKLYSTLLEFHKEMRARFNLTSAPKKSKKNRRKQKKKNWKTGFLLGKS